MKSKMPEDVNKSVIGIVLAGGEGRRLRPITYYFQKCMIPVGVEQKPILEYIILHFRKHGILNIKLLVGYKHEQIVNYFENGSRFGVKINYYNDNPSFAGSGGSLLNAANNQAFVGYDALLVYYGDILSDINLSDMLRQHIASKPIATLAVAKGFEVPVGVAELEGKEVKQWVEKPKIDIFAGIGIMVLDPSALNVMKELMDNRRMVDIMGEFIPYLLERGERIEAYTTDAFWYDVGSTEKYEKIDNGFINMIFET